LGRSRNGFSTNLHAAGLDEPTYVSSTLTSGARHDAAVFERVFEQCPTLAQLTAVVMDKGDDSDHLRQYLQVRDLISVIPPRQHRKPPILFDTEHYQRREPVERFFNKLKQVRRVATRDEKLGQTFFAFIHVVALWIMLR
jgi:hypothetical protein